MICKLPWLETSLSRSDVFSRLRLHNKYRTLHVEIPGVFRKQGFDCGVESCGVGMYSDGPSSRDEANQAISSQMT